MNVKTVPVSTAQTAHRYEVSVGFDTLRDAGIWARGALGPATRRAAVISNPKVSGYYGPKVAESLRRAGFEVFVFLIKDGERYKNLRTLAEILGFLGENRISRTDAVVALGGGVVGDVAGFAAAVHLRGIPFLQIPTTLLAMIDSSVGGKTGVNTAHGKNLAGAFHQPAGILIDVETLGTLPRRELTAGFCEAVKHGALAGRELLSATGEFLGSYPIGRFKRHFDDPDFLHGLARLVADQVSFKAEIVAGDEFESADRTDGRSRKILNFGHTLAHALEKVTNYSFFKHGEAVGHGILFAAELSKSLDLLKGDSVTLLNDVMHRVGSLPSPSHLGAEDIFNAFSFDKKNIGNSLQWVLLKELGEPLIIPAREIPESAIKDTLDKILKG